MSSSMTNPQNDRRTLTHKGAEVGDGNVDLLQNSTGVMSPVLQWTCPRKFRRIDYAAGTHPTRATFRTVEEYDGTSADLELATNILPNAGEPTIDDQPRPTVRVVDTTTGEELDIDDVSYGSNTVHLAEAPGNAIKAYPMLGDGYLQYRGIDQFSHEVASLDHWGTPIQDFADHNQLKENSTIHLVGSIQFAENETLALYLNASQQVVWTDDDYPDAYVSNVEQKVDVSV